MNSRSKRNNKLSRRRWFWSVLTAAALALGWLVYTSANIMFPAQQEPQPDVEAIVSLAPQYDRLPTAVELFEQTDNSSLLISYFPHDAYMHTAEVDEEGAPAYATYCDDTEHLGVTCFTPEDATTLGEVVALDEMAEQESWESITVVTSTYHAFRTRLIVDRCIDSEAQVKVVYAETDLPTTQWLWHLVYENAAYPKALIETALQC